MRAWQLGAKRLNAYQAGRLWQPEFLGRGQAVHLSTVERADHSDLQGASRRQADSKARRSETGGGNKASYYTLKILRCVNV